MSDSEEIVFAMGNYPARIPVDRLYSTNHLWLQADGDSYRVGLTAYSVRLLQDVYFLDWTVDAGSTVRHKQEIGQIESSKAVSSLYAPAEGELLEFNPLVLADPSFINTAGYDKGWLYRLRSTAAFLSPADYLTHLAAGWEKTQNLLKGQVNEG